MFILRKEHEDAFGKAGLHRFAKKAIRMLRQDYAEVAEPYDDKVLSKLVDECMTLSREHGLKTERQMYHVIISGLKRLSSLGSNDLKHDSRVRSILANTVASPDQRSSAVLEYLTLASNRRQKLC